MTSTLGFSVSCEGVCCSIISGFRMRSTPGWTQASCTDCAAVSTVPPSCGRRLARPLNVPLPCDGEAVRTIPVFAGAISDEKAR